MEYQDKRNRATVVIAVVTEDETSTSLQSMEFGDSQSNNEELSALVGSFVASGAGMYESHEDVTLHNEKPNRPGESAQVPSQDTSALDDGDRCKHLRKTIPVCSSVAPDCYSPREADTEKTFLVSLPGNVSLNKGRQNTEMGLAPSLDNYQRDIDAGHREEKASASENSAHHPTDRLVRGAFTPKLLQEKMLKACLALEEEKQAEERALIEISYCLERVSSMNAEVKSSAVALFDCVTVEDSAGGVCHQTAHLEGSFVTLDNRHKTVEDYVRVAYAEAFNQEDANVFDSRLKTKGADFANRKSYRTPSKIVKKTAYFTRGKSYNTKENFRRNMDKRHTALLLQLLHLAADVRNEIVGQYRILSKLCSVVYVHVCQIEVSCRIVLNTVKSVANVVRPALESVRIVHSALNAVSVREIPGTGRSAAPGDDSTLPDKWAQLALTHAETAIRLHDEVALVLTEAQKQLESLQLNVSVGRDVLHHSNDFEKYVLDLIQQPDNINFDELREKQEEVAFLRDMLSSILEEMIRCPDHIISSSERTSSAVEKVLVALTSATENSCSAMEKSMDALINVAVSKED